MNDNLRFAMLTQLNKWVDESNHERPVFNDDENTLLLRHGVFVVLPKDHHALGDTYHYALEYLRSFMRLGLANDRNRGNSAFPVHEEVSIFWVIDSSTNQADPDAVEIRMQWLVRRAITADPSPSGASLTSEPGVVPTQPSEPL